MITKWNEQQREYRNRFAALGQELSPHAQAAREADAFDPDTWRRIAEAGIFRLPIASPYGGLGRTWWDFAAAFEGLASTLGDLGTLLSIIAHMGAVRVIDTEGSVQQKKWLMPRLTAGEIAATATTEPTGGSDVARIRSAAVAKEGILCLSGTKAHITNAPIAGIFVILGRIPHLGARQDISLFIVTREMQGISTAAAEEMLGNTTSPTGDIALADVPVENQHILGPAGDGLRLLYGMLTFDRLMYALTTAGVLEPLIEAALRFTDQRTSFAKRLAEHQYVQDKIITMKVSMEQARLLAYAALDRLLQNDPEAALMGSVAKLVGTDGLCASVAEYLQLHGHAGYLRGPIANLMCDALATRIAGGTNELQKVNIFRQLEQLRAAKRPPIEGQEAAQ